MLFKFLTVLLKTALILIAGIAFGNVIATKVALMFYIGFALGKIAKGTSEWTRHSHVAPIITPVHLPQPFSNSIMKILPGQSYSQVVQEDSNGTRILEELLLVSASLLLRSADTLIPPTPPFELLRKSHKPNRYNGYYHPTESSQNHFNRPFNNYNYPPQESFQPSEGYYQPQSIFN